MAAYICTHLTYDKKIKDYNDNKNAIVKDLWSKQNKRNTRYYTS